MLAFCPVWTLWDPGSLETLISDVLEVSYLLVPLSICLALWLYYRNRSETFTVLGLDEDAAVPEMQTCSWSWRLIYLSVLTFTFFIGLLTSQLFKLIDEVITTLLK